MSRFGRGCGAGWRAPRAPRARRPTRPRTDITPRTVTRTAYWRGLPLLAALACGTRLPSFVRPLWNPDEGYLASPSRPGCRPRAGSCTTPSWTASRGAALAVRGRVRGARFRLADAAAGARGPRPAAHGGAAGLPPGAAGATARAGRRECRIRWSRSGSTPRTRRPPPSRCSHCPARPPPCGAPTAGAGVRPGPPEPSRSSPNRTAARRCFPGRGCLHRQGAPRRCRTARTSGPAPYPAVDQVSPVPCGVP